MMHATGVTYLALLARRHVFRRRGVYILSYHHIRATDLGGNTSRDVAASGLAGHLRFLTRWFDIVSLEQAAQLLSGGELKHDVVALTFDDGYADNYSQALSVLQRFQARATIFLITGVVGTDAEPWYDEAHCLLTALAREGFHGAATDAEEAELAAVWKIVAGRRNTLSGAEAALEMLKGSAREFRERVMVQLRARVGKRESRPEFRLLSWDQAREMRAHGVTFGSHTVRHPLLPTLDDSELETELVASRDDVSRALGTSCEAFAFPNGDFDERTVKAVRRAGYRIACTQRFGPNRPGCDLLVLRRVGVGNVPPYVLAFKLSGLAAPFFEARRWWQQWREGDAPLIARGTGAWRRRTEVP